MGKRLLLISNSILHLDTDAKDEMNDFLGHDIKKILFVPYARPGGISHTEYAKLVRQQLGGRGYDLYSIHESKDPKKAVKDARAILIGSGNTFVLLRGFYDAGIIDLVRKRVEEGMPYIGASAGVNVACPSIMTTNDMPIIEPPSLKSLDLVPFQINAHYPPEQKSTQGGTETRQERIEEFLAFNDIPVMGLREGAILRLENNRLVLKGSNGARIFQKGKEPKEYLPPSFLDFLLE